MLMMPRPRTSMWKRERSEEVPINSRPSSERIRVTSSATRLWPRSTRDRTHSLLPIPLAPRTSTPMPRMSIMLPCSLAVGAKSSSRQIVAMFIRRIVVSGDLKTAMSSSSASSSTTRGGLMLRAKIRQGMRCLNNSRRRWRLVASGSDFKYWVSPLPMICTR